jgi:transposase
MKYTVKFKLDCIKKYKDGIHITQPPRLSYHSFIIQVYKWVKRYDDLGINGLKHSLTNKEWTAEQRFELVAKVLAGNSIRNVALSAHIDSGQLYQWVKRYRERGTEGLQCKKGRKSKNIVMKPKKKKLAQSEREELKLLRERNEYLEIENEYLKKLDALVSKREAAHPKAKKQK